MPNLQSVSEILDRVHDEFDQAEVGWKKALAAYDNIPDAARTLADYETLCLCFSETMKCYRDLAAKWQLNVPTNRVALPQMPIRPSEADGN
jgi:hypothetical protein